VDLDGPQLITEHFNTAFGDISAHNMVVDILPYFGDVDLYVGHIVGNLI
tara:strand:+ start:3698 stop:3844 length:147 start_codon:yes stop_codon:yes gene_type:complete